MSSYEEAEILDTGGVIIRYYFGKSVLIPAEVMKREAIAIMRSAEVIKGQDHTKKIALKSRRFVDGGF